jgi:predicted site-specific integrase-resolvase
MSTSAPGPHLRYAELKEWLRENGISEYKLKGMLTLGMIKTNYVNGGRAYYNAEQVKRDVLDLLDDAEISK